MTAKEWNKKWKKAEKSVAAAKKIDVEKLEKRLDALEERLINLVKKAREKYGSNNG